MSPKFRTCPDEEAMKTRRRADEIDIVAEGTIANFPKGMPLALISDFQYLITTDPDGRDISKE